LHERTLAGFERLLGTEHPNTNVVRDNLASRQVKAMMMCSVVRRRPTSPSG
jgi:hypothetical protein